MKWSAALLAAACLAAGPGEKVKWEKPDTALAIAGTQNKLVCWYFLTGEAAKGGAAPSC